MKKNNKGFFLAETVIIVALVTTVMAFVYPNVSKLYDNYKNISLHYDQTEDLYVLKAYSEVNATDIIDKCNNLSGDDMVTVCTAEDISCRILGISELYISEYMAKLKSANYNFNKYLKRLKKTSNDQKACRLIGKFNGDNKYASIKVEKESLYRQLYNVPILKVGDYFIFGNDVIDCTSSNSDGLYVEKINNEWNIEAKVPGDYVLTIKINDSDQIQEIVKVK